MNNWKKLYIPSDIKLLHCTDLYSHSFVDGEDNSYCGVSRKLISEEKLPKNTASAICEKCFTALNPN